jgi:hypothetical protein
VRPPVHVVRAFCGDPDQLTRLPSGQGTSWRAGSVILKPALPGEPIDWLAEACAAMPESRRYRFARWVRAIDGSWSVDGWLATRWLAGEHRKGGWRDRLAVAAAFHADLPRVPPEVLATLDLRTDPWSTGVRVAWGRQKPPAALPKAVAAVLKELAPLLAEDWVGPAPQLIHGDLAGNLLLADDLPPAIIDMSPHLAPAPFSEAIIVADSVAWEGAPASFATWYVTTEPAGRQLLARAVVFRLVSSAVLWPEQPDRVATEVAGYQRVILALHL